LLVAALRNITRYAIGSSFKAFGSDDKLNALGLDANNPNQACLNEEFCEAGYLLQYLIRSKLWSYRRLPLDGLRTIIFLENSPTLCVASGNVWFDYPNISSVGCISHKTLYLLSQKDSSAKSAFDWPTFQDGERLCLRLSSLGFSTRRMLPFFFLRCSVRFACFIHFIYVHLFFLSVCVLNLFCVAVGE
jgi:hypothetical protein